uniref:Protein yippee-like 2 n=1 Tax=Cynoglossus semilaevis TaxID=244447 RepID=A0A3P8WRA9_CYNSE
MNGILGRCSPPDPPPTTALTCVLRCFPCEPTWAGSPFLHRPPTPPMVRMTRSKTFQAYLPTCHRTYSCIHCRAHLANHDELISKSFQGSQGRAYLFNSVVNVGCGPAEERVLLTGLHAVADIYCENCKTTLGWKYSSGQDVLQNCPQFAAVSCSQVVPLLHPSQQSQRLRTALLHALRQS